MQRRAHRVTTQQLFSSGHTLSLCLRLLPTGLHALLEETLHPVTVANGHPPIPHRGEGLFTGFRFHITHSKLEAGQTAAGTFVYEGTMEAAQQALLASGFRSTHGTHAGQREFRTRGHWFTGAGSAHFLLFELPLDPNHSNHTQGEFHFGEHNPYSPVGWLLHWIFEAHR